MGREIGVALFDVKLAGRDEWVKVINSLPPSMLDISGGEPTTYPDFVELINRVDKKHVLALSTNLRGDAVSKILGCHKRFVSINCSWHRGQGLAIDEFADRVKCLLRNGLNCFVNIVDHPSSIDETSKYALEARGIKVFVSPFENPIELRLMKRTLVCNAGLNTFTVDPSGDVYRCLTWFRYSGRNEARMGNLVEGTFKPFVEEQPCNLSCDIYYVLDPHHKQKHMFSTYVRDL